MPRRLLGLWPASAVSGNLRSQGRFWYFGLPRPFWAVSGAVGSQGRFWGVGLPRPFLGLWPARAVFFWGWACQGSFRTLACQGRSGNLRCTRPFLVDLRSQGRFWGSCLPGPFVGRWPPRAVFGTLACHGCFWAVSGGWCLPGPFVGRWPPRAILGLWPATAVFGTLACHNRFWAVSGGCGLPGPFLGRWPPKAVFETLACQGRF